MKRIRGIAIMLRTTVVPGVIPAEAPRGRDVTDHHIACGGALSCEAPVGP